MGWSLLVLFVILAVGGALRLYHVNWDEGQHTHPDERWIAIVAPGIALPEDLGDVFDPRRSPLNPLYDVPNDEPRNFAYGHLPLYLLAVGGRFLAGLASLSEQFSSWPALAGALSGLRLAAKYDSVNLVGRVLSALFDLGSVTLVYTVGRRVYGRWVGLLGAAFAALTVMAIQLSHFGTFDTFAAFFVMLAIYGSVRVVQDGDGRSSVLAGAAVGLAVACKFSAVPVILPLVLAHGARCVGQDADGEWRVADCKRQITNGFLALVVAVAAFALTSPFAILDFGAYATQISEQGRMVRGVWDFPYTRQYRGTLPYVYNVEQQLRWGMGWPLGVVAFAGFAFVLVRLAVRLGRSSSKEYHDEARQWPRRSAELVVLAWVVPYFLITGSFMVKFMRYMLPITPLFCLFGAEMLLALTAWARNRERQPLAFALRVTCYVLPVVVLAASLFYSLAFVGIYARPHTWITASRWIYDHVPDGSMIVVEHWDDNLPKPLPEPGAYAEAHRYVQPELPVYEDDTWDKYDLLVDTLRDADYVVLASNRLYRSIPRLPRRYPMTSRYYQLLFSGELGFRLEESFTSYPSLLGVTFADDEADESFTVYDHPKPLLFVKVRDLSDREFEELLGTALERGMTRAQATEGSKTLLLSEPVDELPVVDDFHWNGLANRYHLLAVGWWWLVVGLLGLVAWPLTFLVFRHLHDRGYGLAKSLGLLVVAYLTWLPASLHLLPNRVWTVLAAVIVVALASLVLGVRHRGEMLGFWRRRFGLIVFNETLFLAAYLLFVGIRVLNPDLWQPWLGGEKPMEFAFLNAILKSAHFPPYDPYFAGGYINYYYYGQFIIATLIKLTGIVPPVAFNLAVPTLFALTVSNAFCLGYNLAVGAPVSGPQPGGQRMSPTVLNRLVTGLLAGLFVAVLGNLAGAAQLWQRLGEAGGSKFTSVIPGWQAVVRAVPGLVSVLSGRATLPFDYWAPTRVIPYTINEFPFFSFLFADLHPHVIGIPFTILLLALALNLSMSNYQLSMTNYQLSIIHVIPIAFVLGALAVINTWDFPTYLGIVVCILLLREMFGNLRTRPAFDHWPLFIVHCLLLIVASLGLYWPFFAHYKALFVGIGLVGQGSPLEPFLTIWGFFLFVVISCLLVAVLGRRSGLRRKGHGEHVEPSVGRWGGLRWLRLAVRHWQVLPHLGELSAALVHPSPAFLAVVGGLALAVLMAVVLAVLGAWVMALLLVLVIVAGMLVLQPDLEPETRFAYLLVFTGLLVLLGCEIVYLRDFLGGGEYRRMNTLFKFYVQVWVLLAIAAGALLPRLLVDVERWPSRAWRWAWSVAFAYLLMASLVYSIYGTRSWVNDRFPDDRPPLGTLDGMAYMTVGSFSWPEEDNVIQLKYDYEAIWWLLRNVRGTPVVAEANLPYYREGGLRVSTYTGLPTLLGMHQSEQRYDWQVGQRDGQVREFFNTSDGERAAELIHELRISYVYVGQLERTTYDAAGLAKFERLVDEGYLTVPYSNPEVTIYRVAWDRLPELRDTGGEPGDDHVFGGDRLR